MAIAKKPTHRAPVAAPANDDQAADVFISGAGKPPATPSRGRSKKIRVMTQFDEAVLARVDTAAERRGISRSAWIQFVISQALDQGAG